MVDEYRLKITIHSVQIDIATSIKMVIHSQFKSQTQQTSQKCKLSIIKAISKETNTEQELKIADFKNQQLFLNVSADSPIQYYKDHLSQIDSLPQENWSQECQLKLMAVSTNKSKLIGILNYKFEANTSRFKPLERKTITFNKSIDKNASICFSSEL